MTALAAHARRDFGIAADTVDQMEKIDGAHTVWSGAFLEEDTSAGGVKPYDGTGTTGFAGVAVDGGTQGEQIMVRKRGLVLMTVTGTVSASSVGATVYATTDDNTLTLTSTSNLPVGKITKVITTGAAGTNAVWVQFEADSLRSV